MLPKALKRCPKSNKSPNLVTLLPNTATEVRDSRDPGLNPVIGHFYLTEKTKKKKGPFEISKTF